MAPLTDAELERAARLANSPDRDDYVAAHLLVRRVAANQLRVPPPAVKLQQRCEACGGPHGRPEVPGSNGLWLSLSHTHGWVGAVAADRPCGIDVEIVAGPPTVDLVDTVLTEAEQRWMVTLPDNRLPPEFARLWVRKEAVVKAGAARLDDIGDLDVLGDSPIEAAGCEVRDVDVHLGVEVVAAVALLSAPGRSVSP